MHTEPALTARTVVYAPAEDVPCRAEPSRRPSVCPLTWPPPGPSVQASVLTAQHQSGQDGPQGKERPEGDEELPGATAADRMPDSKAGEASSNYQECPPVPVERIPPLRGSRLSHDSALPRTGAL